MFMFLAKDAEPSIYDTAKVKSKYLKPLSVGNHKK